MVAKVAKPALTKVGATKACEDARLKVAPGKPGAKVAAAAKPATEECFATQVLRLTTGDEQASRSQPVPTGAIRMAHLRRVQRQVPCSLAQECQTGAGGEGWKDFRGEVRTKKVVRKGCRSFCFPSLAAVDLARNHTRQVF